MGCECQHLRSREPKRRVPDKVCDHRVLCTAVMSILEMQKPVSKLPVDPSNNLSDETCLSDNLTYLKMKGQLDRGETAALRYVKQRDVSSDVSIHQCGCRA